MDWFDEEYKAAIKKKSSDRIKMLSRRTSRNCEHYRESRREANHVYQRKKRDYMKRKVKNIENFQEQKQIRSLYQEVRSVSRCFQPKMNV